MKAPAMTNSAPLARVEAMARREADATGRPYVVLNLNRVGAPLYVCRELRDGMNPARIVSRFDPAPAATVEPAVSAVGAPAADITAYEVDRAEAIHGLGRKSDDELRTLAAHFRAVAPQATVAGNRRSSEAIVAACERLIARRGAMVPQPCQQQQAYAAMGQAARPVSDQPTTRDGITARTLEAHCRATGIDHGGRHSTALYHLLCDVLTLCDAKRIDFDALLSQVRADLVQEAEDNA